MYEMLLDDLLNRQKKNGIDISKLKISEDDSEDVSDEDISK